MIPMLVLAAVMSVNKPVKPIPQVQETYEQKFSNQLRKANTALRTYSNTPCDVKEYRQAATNLKTEAKAFLDIYDGMPTFSDDDDKTREVEEFIGFIQLLGDATTAQNDCIEHSNQNNKGTR